MRELPTRSKNLPGLSVTSSSGETLGPDRLQRAILGALLAAYGLIVLSPMVAFAATCFLSDGKVSIQLFKEVLFAPRTLNVLARTSGIALATACTSTFGGWLIACGLSRLGVGQARAWLIALMAGFLVSPYVFTQGWIGWLGDAGRLWRWLGLEAAPYSIYSLPGSDAHFELSRAQRSSDLLCPEALFAGI
ncbi:MAG: hypothetical protein L0Z50_14335 [Verrucomicrobiales bacterium]|nr:hypothetical protein [Verrucomicrobiales bacterium]